MNKENYLFFKSKAKELRHFAYLISNDEIKNEPMFFNADINFAYKNGGDITKSFINNLPDEWQESNVVFDSRVHMLMKGWYPCIPGWHHDDVPRTLKNGQPNYENPEYFSEHILGIVNSNICPTKFAIGEVYMPKINDDRIVYEVWNEIIESEIKEGILRIDEVNDRTLTYFDCNTFHTGQKAINNGWRWFGRVSRNTNRINNITNEIRVNSQVYLEFPKKGW
ncbi:MAG: hypothetical protein RIR55_609 [Bacteroidota bacterium]